MRNKKRVAKLESASGRDVAVTLHKQYLSDDGELEAVSFGYKEVSTRVERADDEPLDAFWNRVHALARKKMGANSVILLDESVMKL